MDQSLNEILNTEIKVRILRLFAQREDGYRATGREVARQVNTTAPSAHAALKALYDQHIFMMEPLGRSHVYALNRKNRLVQDVVLPAFSVEKNIKNDMASFFERMVNKSGIESKIISIILYGSRVTGTFQAGSDVDVAVIAAKETDVQKVSDVFLENIVSEFFDYFGMTLDPYVESRKMFMDLSQKNLPPVSTLKKSYEAIYGRDILKGGK